MEVTSFAEEHVAAGSTFLAARHVRERRCFPLLSARYEDPAQCEAVLRQTMKYADGAAAVDDGRTAALLHWIINAPDPSSPPARFSPPRSSMFLAHGHAIAPGVDPWPAYHALFTAAAERLLDADVTDHVAHVPAGDAATVDAWYGLGFGRVHAYAVRGLDDDVDAPGDLDVRLATPDDLDLVVELSDEESRYHATSPILRPYVREQTEAAVRAMFAETLAAGAEDRAVFLVGDVGVLSIGPPFGSPVCAPDGATYIGETAVLPSERGRGVGAALLAAAVDWARERDHRALTLHFAAMNALSSSFWTGQGFEVVMWQLRRRLDERILTMRPR